MDAPDNSKIAPYSEILPSANWTDIVKCYWSAGRVFTDDRPLFEILPDSYAELVFSCGAECSLVVEGRNVGLPNPFMIGLLNAPLYLHAHGRVIVFGVRLYPWALSRVAEGYGSGQIREWLPRVQVRFEEGGTGHALEALRELFECRLSMEDDPGLTKAGRLLLSQKGNVTPSDLAATANASLRTLQRMFRRSCGETAKSISRRMRFERVRDHIWEDPEVHLTRLAYEYGFADQAHFNHEFQFFSHKTPGQFAREARGSKAFLEANSVVYIQSGAR